MRIDRLGKGDVAPGVPVREEEDDDDEGVLDKEFDSGTFRLGEEEAGTGVVDAGGD